MTTHTLQPLFPFKEDEHANENRNHQAPSTIVTVFKVEFWHIIEVHSIDACNECERNKQRSNNGKHFHDLIHFITHIGHVHFHKAG